MTSPFFLLLSEHKHCNNAATDSNSENARSRMVVSLLGSTDTGTKGDESSTGCVWAAGFHHVTAHSHLARGLELMNRLFIHLIFQIFLGHGEPHITETMGIESADTGVHLYIYFISKSNIYLFYDDFHIFQWNTLVVAANY